MKEKIVLALGLVLGLTFVGVAVWKSCHGQCKQDVKCQERCLDREYCPFAEKQN